MTPFYGQTVRFYGQTVRSRMDGEPEGRTVRVDLARSARLSRIDAEPIVAATEELLDDQIVIVEVVGPADVSIPPRGSARVVRTLHRLAERRGQQLIVGSI